MFKLATYNGKQFPAANRFYILNKGDNSGKPSLVPFANSFVCSCDSKEESDMLYILSYGLWQSQQYKGLLVGSVIEFLRIDDCYDLLLVTYRQACENPTFSDVVRKLMAVDNLLELRREEEKQLKRLKIAMIAHHMRPRA